MFDRDKINDDYRRKTCQCTDKQLGHSNQMLWVSSSKFSQVIWIRLDFTLRDQKLKRHSSRN